MKFVRLSIIMLFVLMLPAAVLAQDGEAELPYDNVDTPIDLLASYYNAINLRDYVRAYRYWQSAPNSFEDFVIGFEDTVSVQLIIQPPTRIGVAAGSQYGEIKTVLIAEHVDGTEETYSGCFVTRKSNLTSNDVPAEDLVWHLYDANLELISLQELDIPMLLKTACDVESSDS